MTNPFTDQAQFMSACEQVVSKHNGDQYRLYLKLIQEEVNELTDAVLAQDKVEQLDALIDILVVTIGALHSLGVDAEGAWNEVMRTNFAKINAVTGKVLKRGDGKILKPQGWQPPSLEQYILD